MFQPTILQAPRYGRFSVKLGVALLLTFFLLQPAIHSQELQALEVGKPIERELAGDQAHSYQLSLAAGQFLDAVVEQKGIDVVVTLFGPDGKKLIEVDSPNGTQGPEPMQWVTAAAGAYRLEVRSLEKEAKAGRYEVKVVALRAATAEDRLIVEALGLYAEAVSLQVQRKYDEATARAERALALREQALGPNHVEVAGAAGLLAELYRAMNDFSKAVTMYERSIAIQEKTLGPEHTEVATSLNNLALLYHAKGDYVRAEPLHLRALTVREKALGPEHTEVATSLNNLALLYHAKGDYVRAESLLKRALAIEEKMFGPDHPEVALSLNNLAGLYHAKGDLAQVEPLLQRALAIWEKTGSPEHPNVAASLTAVFARIRIGRLRKPMDIGRKFKTDFSFERKPL